MATYAFNQSAYETLVATVADTITIGSRSGSLFVAPYFKNYLIFNVDGASAIYYTYGDASEGGSDVVATIKGDGTYFLPALAGASQIITFSPAERLGIVFSVISAGTPQYAIVGLLA